MNVKYPRLVAQQQHALAIVRIFLGLLFLFLVTTKLDAAFVAGFARLLRKTAETHPLSLYAGLIRGVFLASPWFFAYVLILSELLVGVCLVLGLFTAPAALWGAVIQLNYLLVTYAMGPYAVGLHLTLIVVLLALAWSYAGTTWGVDRTLINRTPHWLQGVQHFEFREF